MREIAGPHGGASVTHAQIDVDADLLASEMLSDGSFIVIGKWLAVARGPAPAQSPLVAMTLRGRSALAAWSAL